VLEGVPGLSVVNERNEGFDAAIAGKSGWNKVGAQTANWKTDEGKSVIETVLKANNNNIQFIFAQNDEMGIGAAQAVTAAGLKPGTDVKIATIDGTKGPSRRWRRATSASSRSTTRSSGPTPSTP
jgi:simple sugar transport system substrate-binding protein